MATTLIPTDEEDIIFYKHLALDFLIKVSLRNDTYIDELSKALAKIICDKTDRKAIDLLIGAIQLYKEEP